MYKELVLIKDINDYWSCVLCFTCTHNKNVIDNDEAITLIKTTYPVLANCEFIVENNEIFAMTEQQITAVNVKEGCEDSSN
jgi:heterodisulfide reductase subunit C